MNENIRKLWLYWWAWIVILFSSFNFMYGYMNSYYFNNFVYIKYSLFYKILMIWFKILMRRVYILGFCNK